MRAVRLAGCLLTVALVSAACDSDDDAAIFETGPAPAATSIAPRATTVPEATIGDTTRVPDGSGTTVTLPRPPGRTPLPGFGEVAIRVIEGAGLVAEWCLMLADTPELRGRGLMEVTDTTLGGYDGMIFRFEGRTTSSFYMLRTRIPLSIAFYDGPTFVSATDMVPCPDDDDSPPCPRYPAAGPYTDAIEVPAGNLERLGLGAGATLEVGGACPALASG